MYELKKNGKVFTSKFVGTGPSSYEKRIYWATVSQSLEKTVLELDRASDFLSPSKGLGKGVTILPLAVG